MNKLLSDGNKEPVPKRASAHLFNVNEDQEMSNLSLNEDSEFNASLPEIYTTRNDQS